MICWIFIACQIVGVIEKDPDCLFNKTYANKGEKCWWWRLAEQMLVERLRYYRSFYIYCPSTKLIRNKQFVKSMLVGIHMSTVFLYLLDLQSLQKEVVCGYHLNWEHAPNAAKFITAFVTWSAKKKKHVAKSSSIIAYYWSCSLSCVFLTECKAIKEVNSNQ